MRFPSLLSLAALAACSAMAAPASPDAGARRARAVLDLPGDGKLLLEACTPSVVRVAFARETAPGAAAAFFDRPTLATAARRCDPAAAWTRADAPGAVTLSTGALAARVDTATGAVTFLDAAGRIILAEKRGGGRTLTTASVQGEATQHVRQQWEPAGDESLYGLGQHQQGLLDLAGHDLDLRQYNSEVFIPFLVSSRGYGILWDNTSFTRFGDLRAPEPLPGLAYAPSGDVAGTATGRVDVQVDLRPAVTGDHLLTSYASGDLRLEIDGRPVVDHWRQGWLPNTESVKVRLTAGKPARLRVRWAADGGVKILKLGWKPPAPAPAATSLWSEAGDGVDYTFVYGPELDAVVAGYRRLTGPAALLPRWAFGFIQCRERYRTAREVTDVVAGFRKRGIPLDGIVQDWQYYRADQWGAHTFDPARFPEPEKWIASLHRELHARLMISVWPKLYTSTANFAALDTAGLIYRSTVLEKKKDFRGHPYGYYDAFDPRGRAMFWDQLRRELLAKQVDAWWLDASEPEVVEGPFPSPEAQIESQRAHMHPTAAGSGARVLNAYSLVNSQAIYEGQRAAAPDRRVFILTRSGFAGQQRYGAATWSGDITATWSALRKQLPAGLGFSLSGLPWWTMDGGGFAVPPRFASMARGSAALEEWRELATRWLEAMAFMPLMRVHGQHPAREPWEFGGDDSPALRAQVKFIQLRYRLLPYVYSLAGAAAHAGGTLLRPLVMDFRDDGAARAVTDQFMFGPALLVSPVTAPGVTARPVYLPPVVGGGAAGGWYDLWTGASLRGGQTVQAPAPFDAIPVHVRAGSIIPLGPALQWSDEKPADPITLWVYAGADGDFTLYEDDGASYGYERGAFARIRLRWDDARRTLAIGAREGSFPGVLGERTFQVVLVGPGRPAALSPDARPAATVRYRGGATTVELR